MFVVRQTLSSSDYRYSNLDITELIIDVIIDVKRFTFYFFQKTRFNVFFILSTFLLLRQLKYTLIYSNFYLSICNICID